MRITKTSANRGLLGAKALVAVAASLVLVAGPAQAAGSGAGTFVGHEHAPDSTLTNPPTLCAKFSPTAAVPLAVHLTTDGTFTTGTPGSVYAGTAKVSYTNTSSPYHANPVGTYGPTDSDCDPPALTAGYKIPGNVQIQALIGVGTLSCSGTGTYERNATSVGTLTFTGTCTINGTAVSTTVTFRGAIEPCPPPTGCPVVHPDNPTNPEIADALFEGAYTQS